jgi:hypothetical protein
MRFVVPLIAVVACVEQPSGPAGPSVSSHTAKRQFGLPMQFPVDVLFVVENSPQMAAHRATLVANAQNFVAALDLFPFGRPDLHLGVITSDVGSRGGLDNTATAHGDCSENGDAGIMKSTATGGNFWIDTRAADGNAITNYTGSLADQLAATIEALPTGCSFPRPLEAVRRAVANPSNAGFVRDRAQLAIVFLGASDDCSFQHQTFLDGADAYRCVDQPGDLVSLDDLAMAVKNVKADPAMAWIAGAFGPATPFVDDPQNRTVAPSCTSSDQSRTAQPGVRLQAYLDRFPNRSLATSICDEDVSEPISFLAQGYKVDLGLVCFDETVIDVDPSTPGDQYECAVSYTTETFGEVVLPPCRDGETRPCWRLEVEPLCPDGSMLTPKFDNLLPFNEPALATIECVVE